MRDMLEDAEKHRDDGYGRAQAHVKQHQPKRFYKETGVGVVEGGFTVTLDSRATRTPGKVPVVVPVAGIATTMAEQWAAQGEKIDAETMPMVRLVNSALEGGEAMIPAFRDEIIKFAGNDLLLYRVDSPRELVAEHEALWDGALVALARHFGVRFQPTIGIIHQPQPEATLARLAEALQDEGLFVLAPLVAITAITGSGLLAIGLWHRLFTPDHVWTVAHVDEDFQARLWGQDEEAMARRAKRRVEFDTAVQLLEFMRPG
jgi:chaperone required for assembly of F1-ATPase